MSRFRLNCPVDELCPSHCHKIAYQTEVIINKQLIIPEYKPPKEEIINVVSKTYISKFVHIPVCDEGHWVGCKVLVAGRVELGIEYSAAEPEQTVHFAHFDPPFQGLITGGPCQEPIPPCDCDLNSFELHVCTEHLQVDQVDHRTLQAVIVLMLWLERTHHF